MVRESAIEEMKIPEVFLLADRGKLKLSETISTVKYSYKNFDWRILFDLQGLVFFLFFHSKATTMESRFLTSKENKNWLEKSEGSRNRGQNYSVRLRPGTTVGSSYREVRNV